MPRNSRSRTTQSYHPYRSPDKAVESTARTSSRMSAPPSSSATKSNHYVVEQVAKEEKDYRLERRKIIALLKNWHVRVQHKLGFDASLETVKARWTRFLDIDLLMDLQELEELQKKARGSSDDAQQPPPTTSQINEMFKDVVAFLEAKQPCGSKLTESDHTYHYQGQAEMPSTSSSSHTSNSSNHHHHHLPPPSRIPLSDEVTRQLQETHQRLKDYFEGSIRRLGRGKLVSRRKVFASCNSFIATGAVLGDTDTELVDRLLTALTPTAADLLFIDKRMAILSQHLKEQAPAMVAPITPTDVKWEHCYTQQGRPMIQVDGYLFYVCPRQKKLGKKEQQQQQQLKKQKKAAKKEGKSDEKKEAETVSYFRCITNRKGAPKCPVRIKLNCRNEIVFQNGRQHIHPPVDISKYTDRPATTADQRKQVDQTGDSLSTSSDQSSQM